MSSWSSNLYDKKETMVLKGLRLNKFPHFRVDAIKSVWGNHRSASYWVSYSLVTAFLGLATGLLISRRPD